MTTWYVRPDTSHNSTRNGNSYATAWGGWSEIVWGASGVNAGDTLYVCGAHAYSANISIGAHGATSDTNRTTIRGDYSVAGSIALSSSAYIDSGRAWTTIKALTITSTTSGNSIFHYATAGGVIDGCTFTGGDAAISLYGAVAFTSCTIQNCTISGQTTVGITQGVSTASVASSGVTITGNTIHDTGLYGIYLAMASTNNAWGTSTFSGYSITNNTIYNTPGPSIYLRTCNNDLVTYPSVYSPGLTLSGNTVYNCGTISGPNGNHGGLIVSGFQSPVITSNVVRNCYVEGAGVQTTKNKSPLIAFNTVKSIRSGTPTASYQNGYPIDGNGIFFDILTIGGLAFGNYISDLISTGNDNSGTGLSFWNCTNARFVGNIIENCYRGASYGHANETGNELYHNTFINCTVGLNKIGTASLAGNLTAKNNIMVRCANGIVSGANPSLTADYNCIYGATTAYSGVSAGANDLSVNPALDSGYRPTAASVKTGGASVGGLDFYGKEFPVTPPMGAIAISSDRSVSSKSVTTRSVTTRSVAPRRAVYG